MDIFDKFFQKFTYKFDKGYPDMNNDQDVLLLESLISKVTGEKFSLNEKALLWNDVAGESRKLIRLTTIADKILAKTPFTLQDGDKEVVLSFNDPSYVDLFTNQKVDTLRGIGGNSINNFKFFVDADGNEYSLKQIKKTTELGGTGGSKAQTSERQERSLIDAINSVEGIKTIVGANGFEISNIIKAEKQPDPPRAEAYADLRLIRKDADPYLLSAKGIATPSIAGGGLMGVTQINDTLATWVADFYEDAYEYYKKIFDENDKIDYNTNLYKTSYMKDVNRPVPVNLIDDMLRGNEAMGGPVDGYYIGPMEVKYEVKENKIILNGDLVPLEKFADKYEKIFMHIKKRSGDYYFTDDLQTVNGVTMPLIFTNKPGGKMAKSRLGANPKTRGQIII
jgi:hypothetical protein